MNGVCMRAMYRNICAHIIRMNIHGNDGEQHTRIHIK